jgi:hypothetical protein
MLNKPRNLNSLDTEAVVRFLEPPGLPIFTKGQKLMLTEEIVNNINEYLTKANLGCLCNEGFECMFMGDNQPNWKIARLRLAVELVIDDVEEAGKDANWKTDFN